MNGCGRTCCTASRASQANRSSTHGILLLSERALPQLTPSPVLQCTPAGVGKYFLIDDCALGDRSCRPTQHGYDALGPHAPLSLEDCVVGEMERMSHVFSRPDGGHEADLGLNPPQGYVDALGEPINPARFDNGIIISSSEEAWGIEAARVTQA
jgi:hypothetical protein